MLRYLLLLGVLIAGCSSETDDLKAFVRESDKGVPRKVEALPAVKPVETFSYEGFDLPDPFKPRKLSPAKEGAGGAFVNLNRRREPLEAFPLEQLKLAGTLVQGGELYAIFEANKTLYKVKKGNYIGQNFGLVTAITGKEIVVKEIVQDSAGDWAERTSKLPLGNLADPAVVAVPKRDYVVPVLFATNRKKSGINEPARYFLDSEGPLTLGSVVVRVPPKHQPGEIEKPGWWRVTIERISRSTFLDYLNYPKFAAENPEQHFTFAYPIEELTPADFRNDLRKRLHGAKSRAAILYVHGYANSFKDAAYRTAQLTFDLGVEGYDAVPVMFSWPSDPSGVNYLSAQGRIRAASGHLATFLNNIFDITGAGVVHIIAHSMGADVLCSALVKLGESKLVVQRNRQRSPKFNQIILAAPDIKATDFATIIAPAIASRHRVTNYASSNDAAMRLSKEGNEELRAGDTAGGPVEVAGVETIDASKVNSQLLGHSYFADSAAMRKDLRSLLRDRSTPEARGLQPVRRTTWTYWQFPSE